MSKFALILFLLNFLALSIKFYGIYRSDRRFLPAFINFSRSKMGVASINSVAILFLYNLCDLGVFIFFGKLRPFELERIKERIWFAVTDTFLAFAVFSGELSTNMLLSLSVLLFLKYFHFAFEVRVGSIERDIIITKLTIVKNTIFFVFFTFIDLFYVHYAYHYGDYSDNLQQLMVNEYAILWVNLGYNMAKLMIHYIDYLENYTFHAKVTVFSYLYIGKCFLESLIYIFFLTVTLLSHGVLPILFVRPLISSITGFVNAVKTQINCNRVIAYINEICPDTTEEELKDAHDTTCVVCREEMTECKKLPCGHMFHLLCLKSWFQRQQTCPTCRLDILSMMNRGSSARTQVGNQQQNSERPDFNELYEESYAECPCPKCSSIHNKSSNAGRSPDPDNFLHFDPKALDHLDPELVRNELLSNIKQNLAAATYQLQCLEERLSIPKT